MPSAAFLLRNWYQLMPELTEQFTETKPREINPLGLLYSLAQAGVEPLCLLHSGGHADSYGHYDWLLAWGHATADLGWRFGHVPYHAQPEPGIYPDDAFFSPAGVVAQLRSNGQVMTWGEPAPAPAPVIGASHLHLHFASLWTEADYLQKFEVLQRHLQRGDIYEANLCMPLEAEGRVEEPIAVFEHLVRHNKAPFSAYLQLNNKVLISASPERFLAKRGLTILAQPMKGTLRKGAGVDPNALAQSEKERAENVMIVDLIRNDLSQSAARGSVHVNELFGVYSYGPVYQMISTVTSQLKDGAHALQPLCDAFPPGSMTGAPKRSAMHILNGVEAYDRGSYSGILGYVDPDENYDFSVVIRTLECFPTHTRLCVGSAVTVHANANDEYAECLLKADSILKPLQATRAHG
jgi:para-aminobenzoate synthetase component 1